MILKASQRGGGQDLAAHLMRTDENEHVELHEVRGFVSDELSGAFKEAHAVSRGTKCKQYLFSVSLNPPERESVPVDVFEQTADRIERKLGLEDQPRAIVFHEKEGRRHAHCVWSRIDAETMTARQLSHFKTKLRDISRDLYLEHGWKLPQGLMNSQARDPRNFTLAEWQQAKRTSQDPRALKETLQECWAASDGKAAFQHALEERGFLLARGDRRAHVVMDYRGEVYALPRALNLKAKDVRARLGDECALPTIEATRTLVAERMTPTIRRHIEEARTLAQKDALKLAHDKTSLADRHRSERDSLTQDQAKRRAAEERERTARLPRGFSGLWARVTGKYATLKAKNAAEFAECRKRFQAERQAVVDRQLRERQSFQERVAVVRQRQSGQFAELRREALHYSNLKSPPEQKPEGKRTRSRGLDRER